MAGSRGGEDDPDARIRAKALRRAIDEVTTIERMAASARLQSYRSYLQATVRLASPILLAALRFEGVTLDDALQTLAPPLGWPDRRRPRHVYRHFVAATLAGGAGGWGSLPPMAAAYLGDGAVRLDTRSLDALVLRVVGWSIEVSLRIGASRVSSIGGVGRLRLDRALPETVTLGCIGRPLSAVVDHPLLRHTGWTIDRIEGRALGAKSSVIVFATGALPVQLPWGRA